MHDLYIASSWRNPRYPEARDAARAAGFTVHDVDVDVIGSPA